MKENFIPVPKKNQLIIPYDHKQLNYAFTENDIRIISKYCKQKEILQQMQSDLKRSKTLNPFKNSIKKIALKILMWCLSIILLLFLIYVWIGIFLFLFGDPIILITYAYLFIYLFWYKVVRLGIEIIFDLDKSRPLQRYLKSMNKKHFGSVGVQWSVGGGGQWLQIDYLKYLKK